MDFTRQPIIESIITPKEGCKLVVRSSKSAGQEEFFVDALEVVSFGDALFFRSIERPKPFLVPASDYEVLEVREARMVLKNVGAERSIKIGGGREPSIKAPKEPKEVREIEKIEVSHVEVEAAAPAEEVTEKRREKRRHGRRRRGKEEEVAEPALTGPEGKLSADLPTESKPAREKQPVSYISPLLPPPPTLISETIARYKEDALFKGAFFVREESEDGGEIGEAGQEIPEMANELMQTHPEDLLEALAMRNASLEPPPFGTFGPVEEEPFLPRDPTEESGQPKE